MQNPRKTHTGEQRPFSCRCCQKTFLDHSGRRKHELRHPEMRKFGCKFCHKRFSKQNLWQIHEAQHSEGKPFKCRFCDRCFSNKGNRVNHEVVHKKGGSIDVPDGVANMDSTKGNPSQSQAGSSPNRKRRRPPSSLAASVARYSAVRAAVIVTRNYTRALREEVVLC
ncbi:hypothetical protein BSL78_01285 [Apostichopus japonicus]|uniref:C2H2-type domain-containing protein n=1 Tax=Stichopus japonicus TaxID=307972 RepID=A0A2G8LNS6_STIJA|nr:hypothetical protein BSL78_01285 [Apostichopus japonicus]